MSSDRSESKSQKSEFQRPGPDGAVKLCYICINAKTGRIKPKTRPRAVCLSRQPGIAFAGRSSAGTCLPVGIRFKVRQLDAPQSWSLCWVNKLAASQIYGSRCQYRGFWGQTKAENAKHGVCLDLILIHILLKAGTKNSPWAAIDQNRRVRNQNSKDLAQTELSNYATFVSMRKPVG